MRKPAVLVAVLLLAGSCETAQPGLQDAKRILHTFCTLKQHEIVQVLLTPEQLQAGRVVCQAINDPLGTP